MRPSVQSVNNGNFELIVRYASAVEKSVQMQGILVIADAPEFSALQCSVREWGSTHSWYPFR